MGLFQSRHKDKEHSKPINYTNVMEHNMPKDCTAQIIGIDVSNNKHVLKTMAISYCEMYNPREITSKASKFIRDGSFEEYTMIRLEIRSPDGSYYSGPLVGASIRIF